MTVAENNIVIADPGHLQIDTPADASPTEARDRAHGRSDDQLTWFLIIAASVLIVAWTVAIFVSRHATFAVYSPRLQVGVESASAFARLFAALVLFLFPVIRAGTRLRWVASGLVVLGLGGLVFGYLQPLVGASLDFNASVYASLAVRILAGLLFAIGLAPRTPPRLSPQSAFLTVVLCTVITVIAVAAASVLPPLVHVVDPRAAASQTSITLHGLTAWYWPIAAIPLALAIVALMGTAYYVHGLHRGGWLLVAMIFLAGSQLHTMFWPSSYTPIVSTGDVLRLAFAATVAIGGILELRRIAAERTALLAAEQERSNRLEEIGVLKANFTAMVAHELGSPLAAIRGWTEMLATGQLTQEDQAHAIQTIQSQANALTSLVADVQSASKIDRDEFSVRPRPIPLRALLADATAFARTLPGDHALVSPFSSNEIVWADPERIAQVLRNLVGNAAKYSASDTPIELRVTNDGRHVCIEVIDHGYGIHPDDIKRIFDKFGRGRDQSGQRAPGVGLGLYLSRRIVQAHGSDLSAESTPGEGSSFRFELEIVL